MNKPLRHDANIDLGLFPDNSAKRSFGITPMLHSWIASKMWRETVFFGGGRGLPKNPFRVNFPRRIQLPPRQEKFVNFALSISYCSGHINASYGSISCVMKTTTIVNIKIQ
ncbi:MAG: hypothetical protein ACI4QT_00390, partial [Kiritimatiellia bacterium]